MIGEKTVAYQGKGTNLDDLAQKISGYLQGEGFKVQSSPSSPEGNVIQARKGGFLDELIAADRALSIVISGSPDEFTVRVGIGKWIDHLATALIETLLLSDLFLVVDVAEMAWSLEIEKRLIGQIDTFVG
jgi:hypothetical protein